MGPKKFGGNAVNRLSCNFRIWCELRSKYKDERIMQLPIINS